MIYVEGGAKGTLAQEARKHFTKFLQNRCLSANRPRVKFCGNRIEALKRFRHGKATGENCLLLVDSEEVATQGSPWDHPRMAKECPRPHDLDDADLHFMASTMETWLISCPEEIEQFFGSGSNIQKLPQRANLEEVSKQDVLNDLQGATRESRKGEYGKGPHSFKLLGLMDPTKVRKRCPYWAVRFCEELKKRTEGAN